jgi:hypothetical protein
MPSGARRLLVTALYLIVFTGAFGLAIEVGADYLVHRPA